MDVTTGTTGRATQGFFLLSSLRNGEDEAAIFAFDSRLHVVQPFTTDLNRLRGTADEFSRWGMTSLHDAIASAAETWARGRPGAGALVVLTDGVDTGSRLTPAEVSGIASAIDVPVYIVAVVPPSTIRRRDGATERAVAAQGALADLARWTGGQLFVASVAVAGQRRGAADRRGTAPAVPDRVRTGRRAGLASDRVARREGT